MSNLQLYNDDNIKVLNELKANKTTFSVVYADCIYESLDFSWSNLCYDLLEDNGIFYIQTDYHTVAEWKIYLDNLFGKENFMPDILVPGY